MVTKKNNLRYNRARPDSSPLLEREVPIKRARVTTSRFSDQLATEIDRFVEESLLVNLHEPSVSKVFLEKLKKDLLIHYCSREFYHCRLVRKTIENVLHSLHREGHITLREITEYTGGIVKIAYEEPGADPRPWNPSHEIGKILWQQVFKMCGVIFSAQPDNVSVVLKTLEESGFRAVIDLLDAKDFKAHESFLIEPGESLNLT